LKKIFINLPYEEILRREERWRKVWHFEWPDRVPVLHYIGARYWLPLIGFGKRFKEYLNDPGVMLEAQLLGAKWILENVRSDFSKIVCYPDFMWVEDVSAFGAKVVYPDDDSPWIARPHLLEEKDDLDPLLRVDYVNNGLHGKMIAFYQEMKKRAEDYEIQFLDGKVISAVDCVYMGGGGIIGPTVIAGDLYGVDNLLMALFDRPAWVQQLLSIIVDKALTWLDSVWKIGEGKAAFCSYLYEGSMCIGDDGTAQLSPGQFEDFTLQPLKKLSKHLHDKGLKVMAHNCGKADHILKYWMEEIGIDVYFGFSYLTDKQLIRELMGGKAILIGGIDPVKLLHGTPADVREDVRKTLEVFKFCPGYIIMDGHNVAPGTPVENLNAVTEAAEQYGSF